MAEEGKEEKAQEKAIARLSLAIRAILKIEEDPRPEPPLKRARADGDASPGDTSAVAGQRSPEDTVTPARCVCVMLLGMRGSGKTAVCNILHEVTGGAHIHYDEIGASSPKKGPRKAYTRELRAALARTLQATRHKKGESPEARQPIGEGDNFLLIDRTNILRSQRMDAIVEMQKLKWKQRGCRTLLVEFVHPNDEMGYALEGQLSKRYGDSHVGLCVSRIEQRGCAHHALKPSARLRTVLQKEAKAMEPVSPEEQRHFDRHVTLDVCLSPPETAAEITKVIRERGWLPTLGSSSDWSIKAELAWQLFTRAEERWRQGMGSERGTWLAQCRQAQAAEKAVAQAEAARARVAGRGQQQAKETFWKFDLPEVRRVLVNFPILPQTFTPAESTFIKLLQLPADGDMERSAQEQGLEKQTMEAMQDALEALRGETFEVKMTRILISETVALALVALPPVVPSANKVPHVVFGMRPGAPEWSVESMLEKVEAEKDSTGKKTVTCTELPTPRPVKGQIQLHHPAS
ncbi:unnamed protein product [Symbiodinium natans]|uniref:Uncharacterized protein n=1 Tax=Symbiodinium natans TaxID=878477 RepID=A0A812UMX1_9DINO|nr:unnamed protein product [Symbiodinium natans]